MEPQEDAIVDIPANRIRFFGTSGKMHLPGPATVGALIKKIPKHRLVTTDCFRKMLTDQFNVQGTCPVTTQKALQTVANDSHNRSQFAKIADSTDGTCYLYSYSSRYQQHSW